MIKKTVAIALLLFVFAATVAQGQDNGLLTNAGFFASLEKAELENFLLYVAQQDYAAAKQVLLSQKVFSLKPGVKVFLTEGRGRHGIVKVRPAGQTFEIWTTYDAIMPPTTKRVRKKK